MENENIENRDVIVGATLTIQHTTKDGETYEVDIPVESDLTDEDVESIKKTVVTGIEKEHAKRLEKRTETPE